MRRRYGDWQRSAREGRPPRALLPRSTRDGGQRLASSSARTATNKSVLRIDPAHNSARHVPDRHRDCSRGHRMLRVDLHTHTADDPVDDIPYSTCGLIDARRRWLRRARHHASRPSTRSAAVPAVRLGTPAGADSSGQRTIEGKHVLLLNFPRAATANVRTFDDLRALKERHRGLIVAPHPFFSASSCLWTLMDRRADLFDAVERNAMCLRAIDFDRCAERWASARGKQMVGNGDVHRLEQLGTTYSLVGAAPQCDSICSAIAAGRVRVVRPADRAGPARLIAHLAGRSGGAAWERSRRSARRRRRHSESDRPTRAFSSTIRA